MVNIQKVIIYACGECDLRFQFMEDAENCCKKDTNN